MPTSFSERDRAEQFQLMQLVELVGPIVHEGNNFLNVVFLQVAILELEASEASRAQLKEIRRQGTAFKTLLQQLQSYRQRYQPPIEPVDLNRVVQSTLAELTRQRRLPRMAEPPGGFAVQTALEPNLPPVLGWTADLEQLIAFLFINVIRAVGSDDLALTTQAAPAMVLLRLQRLHAESRTTIWDPDSLEGCACGSLVRRLGGRIGADGGAVVMELPRAGEAIPLPAL